MSERHTNRYDVRRKFGVKSVEWRIQKRILERIAHVMRIGNDRLTTAGAGVVGGVGRSRDARGGWT